MSSSDPRRMQVRPDHVPDPTAPRLSSGQMVLVGLLLAAPVVALMWVSSYAREEPRLFGMPFFYWYQFLWVFLAAATTSAAYRIVVRHERRRRQHAARQNPATGPDAGAHR